MVRRSGIEGAEHQIPKMERSAELTSRWSGGALCGTPNSCAVPSSGIRLRQTDDIAVNSILHLKSVKVCLHRIR